VNKTGKTIDAGNKKILIIVDNDHDRKVIARISKKQGYKDIILAQSGKEGILKAQFDNPDIIMLCEQLSDMNGFEVCKQIKDIDGFVTKIIMVTGNGFHLNASGASEAGADDYVVKTPDNKYLMQAISFVAKN